MTQRTKLTRSARRLLVVAVVVMTVVGSAGLAAGTPPSPPHRFFGTVEDTNGDVVGGATIEVVHDGEVVATDTTDADGYYDLDVDGLSDGDELTIRVSGTEASAQHTWESGGSTEQDFTVQDGDHEIAGTVTTQTGDALAGETVEVVYDGSVIASNATTETGTYTFDVADPDGNVSSEQLTVRIPNYGESAQTTWQAGGSEQFDFTVDTTHRLYGTVTNQSGDVVANTTVEVVYDGAVVVSSDTDDAGQYDLSVTDPDANATDEQLTVGFSDYDATEQSTWQSGGSDQLDFTVGEDTSDGSSGDGDSGDSDSGDGGTDDGGTDDGDTDDGGTDDGGADNGGTGNAGTGNDQSTTAQPTTAEPTTTQPTTAQPTTTQPTTAEPTTAQPTTTQPTTAEPTTDMSDRNTPTGSEESGSSTPGFGAGVALVAVLAAALLALRE